MKKLLLLIFSACQKEQINVIAESGMVIQLQIL